MAKVVIAKVYQNFFGKNEEIVWSRAFSSEAHVTDVVERFEDETAEIVHVIYCFLPQDDCASFDDKDAELSELISPYSRELYFMFQTDSCCNCDQFDLLFDECDCCLKPFCPSCGVVRCTTQSCQKTNSGLPSCEIGEDPSTHKVVRMCNVCRGYENLKYE